MNTAPATNRCLISGLAFAEAPRWHNGELWFSDFYTHQVMRVDRDGRAHVVVEVPNQPSGLGWLPDGRLLVVSMVDRKLMRLDPAGLVEVADLSALAGFHCNDMVVDAKGRAYVGNFGFDLFTQPVAPRATVLVRVEPDGTVSVAAEGLWFPNGTVITPDGMTMIIGETFARRLTAFNISADGKLGNRRLWADLGTIAPDGICLDAEGAVWVASVRSNEFVRVLEGGAITQRIAVSNQAIACALGGENGKRLFMVTGRVKGHDEAMAARVGRIDYVDVGASAAAAPRAVES
jgi:sugar lactone lactonase YvrE